MSKPRLIDANALMDYTLNQKSRTIDCNDIARFPTAYDIDKVVEQLEDHLTGWVPVGCICEAIEIVKGGSNETE